ncbi:MAG: alkaline shock response membrane anchor protein AmaP [Clostridia bacterium]|nr:alkaline shock response membrane anchor protein AmaP [Clostridia bacterium]
MKHLVLDRVLVLICALFALLGAAGFGLILSGHLSIDQIMSIIGRIDPRYLRHQIIMIILIVLLVIFAILLIGVILPGKKKRSSSYAIQHNENGMVRISVKALETLVQKVLDEHAELKVVTSSMYSDEENVRVDLHIAMQSDISMPLAISALQKQIKKYLESCSGVMVQEVRVYVDNTTPSNAETQTSPYAIPASLLGKEQEQLPEPETARYARPEVIPEEAPAAEPEAEPESCPEAEVVPENVEPDAFVTADEEGESEEEQPVFSDADTDA